MKLLNSKEVLSENTKDNFFCFLVKKEEDWDEIYEKASQFAIINNDPGEYPCIAIFLGTYDAIELDEMNYSNIHRTFDVKFLYVKDVEPLILACMDANK